MERKKLEEDDQKKLDKLKAKDGHHPQLLQTAAESNVFEEQDFTSKMETEELSAVPKENRKFYKDLYQVLESSDVIII